MVFFVPISIRITIFAERQSIMENVATNALITGLRKYSLSTYMKFIIYSAFGIFAFFVEFKLPEHTFNIGSYSFTYAASKTFMVNHVANFIKISLLPIMPYIVYALGAVGVADLFIRRKKHFKSSLQTSFSIFKMIGLVLLTFVVFNFGPAILLQDNVGPFILKKILIPVAISVPISAMFLPFLLDYGLVDFIGVMVRPIMRPVFKLPGRAAVIMVSAFLGNFSIGHIAVNDQYKQGRMTEKESVIIGTSLSTVSVGFLIVLANNTGIIEYWNIFFWSAFLITLLVALVGIRLYPLRKLPETYYPEVTPNPEPVFKDSLMKNAWISAMNVADTAEPPYKRIGYILWESFLIVATIPTGTMFFGSIGIVVNLFTPFFSWIGLIFYPLFWLIGIPAAELGVASTGAALSFLEVTLPSLLVTGSEYSMRIKYMLAVLPVSSIIFLASFIPCIMGTEIPAKFSHMVIIWLERMVLSIIFAGIFAMILF